MNKFIIGINSLDIFTTYRCFIFSNVGTIKYYGSTNG